MKLSVFAVCQQDKSFDEACAYLAERGVQAVEIGCGGFPGKAHCNPVELLADEAKLAEFANTLKKHNLEIAALSTHGNAVHPNKEIAKQFHDDFENAVLLAEKLGVAGLGFLGIIGAIAAGGGGMEALAAGLISSPIAAAVWKLKK